MHTTHSTAASTKTPAPSTERRTRLRLRDLCDEVIASHRAATGFQLLSDSERAEAQALLGRMVKAPVARQA
jgi:hypothetical protein